MKQVIAILTMVLLLSCTEKTAGHETIANETRTDTVVVNETDPICQMSVKEHLSDTALIDGQVWGFCSPVCKEKYLLKK